MGRERANEWVISQTGGGIQEEGEKDGRREKTKGKRPQKDDVKESDGRSGRAEEG